MAEDRETIFTLEATPVKFGPGSSADAGWELKRLDVTRVLLVTDPGVAALGHPERIKGLIEAEGIEVVVFDRSRVEPTLESLEEAAKVAREANVDGFVSVGGGSAMDTAKVANLVLTHPAPVMDYVNAPGRRRQEAADAAQAAPGDPDDLGHGVGGDDGRGARHPRAEGQERHLPPLPALHAGDRRPGADAHARRPRSPRRPALDVVCHAAESYISRPFDTRPRPASPDERPPYQGSNPVADVWSAKALVHGGTYLRRAVADRDDVEARGFMMLGATMAGVGFGSAGVHIPHACAYPIAGLKHVYEPPGYPTDHPFVPHGHSVIVTAPAAFRFTYDAGARAPPPRRRAAARQPARRPRSRHAAAGPGATDEGRRRPQRDRRAGLHRGRRRRARRGRAQAAAPARRRSQTAERRTTSATSSPRRCATGNEEIPTCPPLPTARACTCSSAGRSSAT